MLSCIHLNVCCCFLAPASPPANVTAMATSPTSINVMWNIVPPIDQNGVITMYEIQYIPLNDFGGQISGNVSNVSGSGLNITLLHLQEYVNYSISVHAYTSEGPGPYSNPEYELTEEDSELVIFVVNPQRTCTRGLQ